MAGVGDVTEGRNDFVHCKPLKKAALPFTYSHKCEINGSILYVLDCQVILSTQVPTSASKHIVIHSDRFFEVFHLSYHKDEINGSILYYLDCQEILSTPVLSSASRNQRFNFVLS